MFGKIGFGGISGLSHIQHKTKNDQSQQKNINKSIVQPDNNMKNKPIPKTKIITKQPLKNIPETKHNKFFKSNSNSNSNSNSYKKQHSSVSKIEGNRKRQKGSQTFNLSGSKFRLLNQLLYTNTSENAMKYFRQNQNDFALYHDGFREQVQTWTENPLDQIIKYLKKWMKKNNKQKLQGTQHHSEQNQKLILDLGCGEGQLQIELQAFLEKHPAYGPVKLRSFDLISKRPFIQIADISNLPLAPLSADACVFCLSLMGTNYIDFVFEAHKVLKFNGQLLIAQVQSRCKEWDKFVRMISTIGFELFFETTNGFFRLLYFTKMQRQQKSNNKQHMKIKINGQLKDIKQYSRQMLNACIYKRR